MMEKGKIAMAALDPSTPLQRACQGFPQKAIWPFYGDGRGADTGAAARRQSIGACGHPARFSRRLYRDQVTTSLSASNCSFKNISRKDAKAAKGNFIRTWRLGAINSCEMLLKGVVMRIGYISVLTALFLTMAVTPLSAQLKKIRFSVTGISISDLPFKVAQLKGF
jgi:hypothetical protein